MDRGTRAAALGTDSGLPDNADPDTVGAAFASLLGKLSQQRRVIVLLDALDQFEATTRRRYVTLVATAVAGECKARCDRDPGRRRQGPRGAAGPRIARPAPARCRRGARHHCGGLRALSPHIRA